jgi:hypothetical protein
MYVRLYTVYVSAIVWILSVPQWPCVKALVPSFMLFGDGGSFKKWDLVGGIWTFRVCPWTGLWDLGFFLFLCFAFWS